MAIEVKVIADSVSTAGARITSLELRYPRFILAEVNTHRVNSRSSSSSRAIPIEKMIRQVMDDTAMPVHWGKNKPGMQATEEIVDITTAKQVWRDAAAAAAGFAKKLSDLGCHKQVANRLLEPFQWTSTVMTATTWENMIALRAHPDAQPEFRVLAEMIRGALDQSKPVARDPYAGPDAWHLPYVTDEERTQYPLDDLRKMSTARCARVSYKLHDGSNTTLEKDRELFDRLVKSNPIHASPLEHCASAMIYADLVSRNFTGWKQFRETWEQNYAS